MIRFRIVSDVRPRAFWPGAFCCLALTLLACVLPSISTAQEWGAVSGRITATDSGFPIPGSTVLVAGTNFGTASDADGTYTLRLPIGS